MEETIKRIMAAVFNLPVDEIKDDSSVDSLESWDSIKHINLVCALEEEFPVEFTDEEILEIVDYASIKKIIAHKLK